MVDIGHHLGLVRWVIPFLVLAHLEELLVDHRIMMMVVTAESFLRITRWVVDLQPLVLLVEVVIHHMRHPLVADTSTTAANTSLAEPFLQGSFPIINPYLAVIDLSSVFLDLTYFPVELITHIAS